MAVGDDQIGYLLLDGVEEALHAREPAAVQSRPAGRLVVDDRQEGPHPVRQLPGGVTLEVADDQDVFDRELLVAKGGLVGRQEHGLELIEPRHGSPVNRPRTPRTKHCPGSRIRVSRRILLAIPARAHPGAIGGDLSNGPSQGHPPCGPDLPRTFAVSRRAFMIHDLCTTTTSPGLGVPVDIVPPRPEVGVAPPAAPRPPGDRYPTHSARACRFPGSLRRWSSTGACSSAGGSPEICRARRPGSWARISSSAATCRNRSATPRSCAPSSTSSCRR